MEVVTLNNKTRVASTIRLMKDMNIKPNFSDIARRYGIDRRTVKKYYEADGIPLRKKKQQFSAWDPYEELIQAKMNLVGITIRGLYEYFKETLGAENMPGTYSGLKAYLRKKDIKPLRAGSAKAHVHFETEPGIQIQVDWIEGLRMRLRSGKEVKFNIYSATLGWSREHIFIYSPSVTMEDFIRCTLDMFRKLGGTTEELLTDNMSALVTVRGKTRKVHSKAAQFFKDIGVRLKLCKVRSPQTKGKDESANRFRSWLVPYNDELETESDIQRLVNETLTRQANEKINETTNLPPSVLFQKEKEYLNPLPDKVLLDSYLDECIVQVVPSTLLVKYKGNGYSVPTSYIGKRVYIYPINDNLYIYDNKNRLITIHSISSKKKNYQLEHYERGLELKGKTDSEIRNIAKSNLMRFDELYLDPDGEKK